jgi:hypothetical protein
MTTAETRSSPRLLVAGLMAVTGAAFFFIFLLQDIANPRYSDWHELPWAMLSRYVLAMGIGGGLSGWLLSGLFGRRGMGGWLLAILGGIIATGVAGILGSAVGMLPDLFRIGLDMREIIPVAFGFVVLPLAIIGQPPLLIVWLILIGLTHLGAKRIRQG